MTTPRRLLLLPQCRLSRELGGSKVQLALADHLGGLGWEVDCLFPLDPADPQQRQRLHHYDVIDWDPRHGIAPAWLAPNSLSLCRFPLLPLHIARGITWPQPLRRRLDGLLDPLRRLRGRPTPGDVERQAVNQARRALALAHTFAVQNSDDRACLNRHGIAADRIVMEPCGLSESEFRSLNRASGTSGPPRLAFLGSFDPRKGCLDLAWLFPRLARRFPELRFRLIGTNGLYQGEPAVRRWFPGWLQPRLEVIPTFPSDSLVQQLSGVSAGVFPSYLEGFGIAVIEQLAAGIPVLAYASPGPADILPPDWLVPRGDRTALLGRLTALLADPAALAAAAARSRRIAEPYRWSAIAKRWHGHYRRLLAQRRA